MNVLDWTATAGTWAQGVITGADGKLSWTYRQSDDGNSNARSYITGTVLWASDLAYEVKMMVATDPTGGRGPCILWRLADGTNFYEVYLSSSSDKLRDGQDR